VVCTAAKATYFQIQLFSVRIKPMTHPPKTGAIYGLHCFRRRFLARVSCKSGTGFVWYQIPAAIRTLFYLQARKWRARDWNDHLRSIPFQLTFGYNTRFNNTRIAAISAYLSSTSLSAMFIFGAGIFFMPIVYGADF